VRFLALILTLEKLQKLFMCGWGIIIDGDGDGRYNSAGDKAVARLETIAKTLKNALLS
jgi:hypothetical protein